MPDGSLSANGCLSLLEYGSLHSNGCLSLTKSGSLLLWFALIKWISLFALWFALLARAAFGCLSINLVRSTQMDRGLSLSLVLSEDVDGGLRGLGSLR